MHILGFYRETLITIGPEIVDLDSPNPKSKAGAVYPLIKNKGVFSEEVLLISLTFPTGMFHNKYGIYKDM